MFNLGRLPSVDRVVNHIIILILSRLNLGPNCLKVLSADDNQGGQRTSQSRDFSDKVHILLLTKTFTSGKKIDSYDKHTLHS